MMAADDKPADGYDLALNHLLDMRQRLNEAIAALEGMKGSAAKRVAAEEAATEEANEKLDP